MNKPSSGKVYVKDNQIICSGDSHFHNCMVDIDQLQFAYVIVDRNELSYLLLLDRHRNSIPTHYDGFMQAYEYLSQKFGFQDYVFFESIYQKVPSKKQIWRKLYPANYQIIQQPKHQDIRTGFEILSTQSSLINWDTSFTEITQHPDVLVQKTPAGQSVFRFKHPVRIGNITLEDLHFYNHHNRKDVPVLQFYAYCKDDTNSSQSYHELKNQWYL